MSRPEHTTEIADLANELGLAGVANPVEAILATAVAGSTAGWQRPVACPPSATWKPW